ncbi:hypothetical protein [Bacillus sp. 179-C3.3 HS]|uniref:hypothetical protein n=1 Tax=Bacillus sp. 179-C3.3 HS TaxID=3232162 RepID=UPI0039A34DEC
MMNEGVKEVLTSKEPLKAYKYFSAMLSDFRFFMFDNNSNNMPIFEDKQFGHYQIQGIADYKNTVVLDDTLDYSKLRVNHCIDFDSNILGNLYALFFGHLKEKDLDLLKMLCFLKENKIQINCSPYLLECVLNNFTINKDIVYNNLKAFSITDHLDLNSLKRGTFDTFLNENLDIIFRESDDRWREIYNLENKIEGKEISQYYLIYCMLLKAFYIKNESKKGANYKFKKLIDSVNSELCAYFENELLLCFMYIDGMKSIESFFGGIQINTQNLFRKIKGMAWDLFHLRAMENHMAERNKESRSIAIHSFASADKGLNKIISLNPIERIAFYKGRAIVKHKDSIFTKYPKFSYVNELEKYKEHRRVQCLKIDYKALSVDLEEEITNLKNNRKM